jgi:glycosyltransferase involved in cell wall biosynthesis
MDTMNNELAQKDRVLNPIHRLPDFKIDNRYSGLRVLFLVADTSACGYYRCILPAHLLRMHGANVEYGSHHSLEAFLKYDIIVAPRQHSADVYEILRFAQWEGKVVSFEIDDDLDSVLQSSPAYTSYHPGSPELQMIPKFMKMADGMTVTTPEIAKWYYQYNRNIAIIENYIDFSLRDWSAEVSWKTGLPEIKLLPIERPAEFEDNIIIGWSGGSTHDADILEMGHGIKRILETHDNTRFAIYASIQTAQNFASQFQLPMDKVLYIPARHFLDFPTGLKGIDIGLAPIIPCQFNLCKSFLKFEEYLAQGATAIGSNVGPYARFNSRHPNTILTVGKGKDSKDSWYEAIKYLIDNPEELQRRKIVGRQLIADQYSLEKNIDKWPASWKAIIDNREKGICGLPDKVEPKNFYKSFGKAKPADLCPCDSPKKLKYKDCCVNAFG